MTIHNPPAYGPGTHVMCDVCRDPYALVQARPNSELVVMPDQPDGIVGVDEATETAIASAGFVRLRDGQVVCGGCARATP